MSQPPPNKVPDELIVGKSLQVQNYRNQLTAAVYYMWEQLKNVGDVVISGSKSTPVDADYVGLIDTEDGDTLKQLSWANIKATLKTYFDSVAQTLSNKSISLTDNTLTGTKAEYDTSLSDDNFAYVGTANTFTEKQTVDKLWITSTGGTGPSSSEAAFQIGPIDGMNLAADANEIVARNNGAISPLFIQSDGDQVNFFSNKANLSERIRFDVNGSVFGNLSGGAQGAGTINAAGLFIDGDPVVVESGVGTISSQDSDNVSITGGSITGITDLAVADGGTGSSTASGARTNLGLAIGSNVQAWSSVLDNTTASFTTADETKLDFISVTQAVDLDAIESASASALQSSDIGSSIQAWDADLDAIAALAKTDGNFIVGNGTTWVAESGSTVRTSLGLAIGTNVQAYSANLDEYAAVNPTTAGLALLDDANASAQRTTLGLGTIATQNANNVNIDGGAIDGTTIGATTPAQITTTSLTTTSTSPQHLFIESDATTDNQHWQFRAQNEQFTWRLVSTDLMTTANIVTIDRADMVVGNINFSGTLQNGGSNVVVDSDISSTVQAYSANLDEYAAVNPTAAGLALLDDADNDAQLVTLGLTATKEEINAVCDGATSGTYTATATGLTTSPTVTVYYRISNNIVFLETKAECTGTSNTTAFTLTGGPVAIRPATNSAVPVVRVVNNSGYAVGTVQMATDGTLTFGTIAGPGTFTNSGSKGAARFCISYNLTDPS